MNILRNGTAMPPGEKLDEYARARGLCRLCGQTQTHRRTGRFLKKLHNCWQPITVKDENRRRDGTHYLVYKGYCIQPTCYSLEEAMVNLGEKPARRGSTADEASLASNRPPLSWRSSATSSSSTSQLPSHPSSPLKTKPRLGSSRTLDMASTVSNTSASTLLSEEEECWHGRNSLVSSVASLSSSTFGVPISIEDSSSRSSGAHDEALAAPPVRNLLDSSIHDPKLTSLDLSGVQLSELNIASIISALQSKKRCSDSLHLDSLLADGCKLNEDDRLAKLIDGLLEENIQVSKLTLRSNHLENVQGLLLFLRYSTELIELNLSKNRLGDEGLDTVMSALVKNSSTNISILNFSKNQVRSIVPNSDSFRVFLSTNQTLTTLHLEHNCLEDAGVQMLASSIASNQGIGLATLCLGDNDIGYDGAEALAEMLSKNTSLKYLRIENNRIGDLGADALLQGLGKNETLHEVTGLYTNQISSARLISGIKTRLKKRVGKNLLTSLSPRLPEEESCILDSLDFNSELARPDGEFETDDESTTASDVDSSIFSDDSENDSTEGSADASEALDILATPSQHRRLVEGSEQGVHGRTTVCLRASGDSEEIGFEAVAYPHVGRRNEAGRRQNCVATFEATESEIEISLDDQVLQRLRKAERTRQKLQEKMKQELQRKINQEYQQKIKLELLEKMKQKLEERVKQERRQRIAELGMALRNDAADDIQRRLESLEKQIQDEQTCRNNVGDFV